MVRGPLPPLPYIIRNMMIECSMPGQRGLLAGNLRLRQGNAMGNESWSGGRYPGKSRAVTPHLIWVRACVLVNSQEEG